MVFLKYIYLQWCVAGGVGLAAPACGVAGIHTVKVCTVVRWTNGLLYIVTIQPAKTIRKFHYSLLLPNRPVITTTDIFKRAWAAMFGRGAHMLAYNYLMPLIHTPPAKDHLHDSECVEFLFLTYSNEQTWWPHTELLLTSNTTGLALKYYSSLQLWQASHYSPLLFSRLQNITH